MMENILEFKGAAHQIVDALTALWGLNGWLFLALAVCMVIDRGTGKHNAKVNHEYTSAIGQAGISRKMGIVLQIGGLMLVDFLIIVFQSMTGVDIQAKITSAVMSLAASLIPALEGMEIKIRIGFATVGLVFYLSNEWRSIQENLEKMGVPPIRLILVKTFPVLGKVFPWLAKPVPKQVPAEAVEHIIASSRR